MTFADIKQLGKDMGNYLYHMVFQRGPMPYVSIGASVLAVILLVTLRPKDSRTYLVLMAACLLPLLAGLEGTRQGLALVEAGWQQFIATNPTDEVISSARNSYSVGRLVARDPFILGLILSVPLIAINTAMYLIMRRRAANKGLVRAGDPRTTRQSAQP